jgi:hypothetical protein
MARFVPRETQNGEIYIRHFVASGENYTRHKQYRDLRFWSEGKADYGQAPQSSFRMDDGRQSFDDVSSIKNSA